MANINSFSENIEKVIRQNKNTISLLSALQQSMVASEAYTSFTYDVDGKSMSYTLPSITSIVNRVQAIEESIKTITTGTGYLTMYDGGKRKIKLNTLQRPPSRLFYQGNPTTFDIDANWFFENLMFPGAVINITLSSDNISGTGNGGTGIYDENDEYDKVNYIRVILSSNDNNARNLWNSTLNVNDYEYSELISMLNQNGISYSEDEDIVNIQPKYYTKNGIFIVTEDAQIINNRAWYRFDTLNYSTYNHNGLVVGQNNTLQIGDYLSSEETLFTIINIDHTSNMVCLNKVSGTCDIGKYTQFNYYQNDYEISNDRVLKIRFGINEYNLIYLKPISKNGNIEALQWSAPIKFASNDLIYSSNDSLNGMTFQDYYRNYVVDWGANMIAEAKENKILAYNGQKPNAPSLNADDFRVVQINTQINAGVDTTEVKNTAAEIQSTKSQIASLKNTIAAQKANLISATTLYQYNSLQQQIATNTNDLNNLQISLTTLVNSFQTTIKENSAINVAPKYHIRGFFPIPELKKYIGSDRAEEIIGFDIMYRYIKEDNTSTELNTFTYTNTDGMTQVTGTFTDWLISQSPMKQKVFDADLKQYVWDVENIGDGTQTNINQIDIPINKGEKVEIKVRSISEAGYPSNPLKSNWSNSIIMSFPSTLPTTNEIASLITQINDDALNLSIQNTLNSHGLITHIEDSIPNPNSVNGLYYKHISKNVAYEDKLKDDYGNQTIKTVSLQDKIDEINEKLAVLDDIKNEIETINGNLSALTQRVATQEENVAYMKQTFDELIPSIEEIMKYIFNETNNPLVDKPNEPIIDDSVKVKVTDKINEYQNRDFENKQVVDKQAVKMTDVTLSGSMDGRIDTDKLK